MQSIPPPHGEKKVVVMEVRHDAAASPPSPSASPQSSTSIVTQDASSTFNNQGSLTSERTSIEGSNFTGLLPLDFKSRIEPMGAPSGGQSKGQDKLMSSSQKAKPSSPSNRFLTAQSIAGSASDTLTMPTATAWEEPSASPPDVCRGKDGGGAAGAVAFKASTQPGSEDDFPDRFSFSSPLYTFPYLSFHSSNLSHGHSGCNTRGDGAEMFGNRTTRGSTGAAHPNLQGKWTSKNVTGGSWEDCGPQQMCNSMPQLRTVRGLEGLPEAQKALRAPSACGDTSPKTEAAGLPRLNYHAATSSEQRRLVENTSKESATRGAKKTLSSPTQQEVFAKAPTSASTRPLELTKKLPEEWAETETDDFRANPPRSGFSASAPVSVQTKRRVTATSQAGPTAAVLGMSEGSEVKVQSGEKDPKGTTCVEPPVAGATDENADERGHEPQSGATPPTEFIRQSLGPQRGGKNTKLEPPKSTRSCASSTPTKTKRGPNKDAKATAMQYDAPAAPLVPTAVSPLDFPNADELPGDSMLRGVPKSDSTERHGGKVSVSPINSTAPPAGAAVEVPELVSGLSVRGKPGEGQATVSETYHTPIASQSKNHRQRRHQPYSAEDQHDALTPTLMSLASGPRPRRLSCASDSKASSETSNSDVHQYAQRQGSGTTGYDGRINVRVRHRHLSGGSRGSSGGSALASSEESFSAGRWCCRGDLMDGHYRHGASSDPPGLGRPLGTGGGGRPQSASSLNSSHSHLSNTSSRGYRPNSRRSWRRNRSGSAFSASGRFDLGKILATDNEVRDVAVEPNGGRTAQPPAHMLSPSPSHQRKGRLVPRTPTRQLSEGNCSPISQGKVASATSQVLSLNSASESNHSMIFMNSFVSGRWLSDPEGDGSTSRCHLHLSAKHLMGFEGPDTEGGRAVSRSGFVDSKCFPINGSKSESTHPAPPERVSAHASPWQHPQKLPPLNGEKLPAVETGRRPPSEKGQHTEPQSTTLHKHDSVLHDPYLYGQLLGGFSPSEGQVLLDGSAAAGEPQKDKEAVPKEGGPGLRNVLKVASGLPKPENPTELPQRAGPATRANVPPLSSMQMAEKILPSAAEVPLPSGNAENTSGPAFGNGDHSEPRSCPPSRPQYQLYNSSADSSASPLLNNAARPATSNYSSDPHETMKYYSTYLSDGMTGSSGFHFAPASLDAVGRSSSLLLPGTYHSVQDIQFDRHDLQRVGPTHTRTSLYDGCYSSSTPCDNMAASSAEEAAYSSASFLGMPRQGDLPPLAGGNMSYNKLVLDSNAIDGDILSSSRPQTHGLLSLPYGSSMNTSAFGEMRLQLPPGSTSPFQQQPMVFIPDPQPGALGALVAGKSLVCPPGTAPSPGGNGFHLPPMRPAEISPRLPSSGHASGGGGVIGVVSRSNERREATFASPQLQLLSLYPPLNLKDVQANDICKNGRVASAAYAIASAYAVTLMHEEKSPKSSGATSNTSRLSRLELGAGDAMAPPHSHPPLQTMAVFGLLMGSNLDFPGATAATHPTATSQGAVARESQPQLPSHSVAGGDTGSRPSLPGRPHMHNAQLTYFIPPPPPPRSRFLQSLTGVPSFPVAESHALSEGQLKSKILSHCMVWWYTHMRAVETFFITLADRNRPYFFCMNSALLEIHAADTFTVQSEEGSCYRHTYCPPPEVALYSLEDWCTHCSRWWLVNFAHRQQHQALKKMMKMKEQIKVQGQQHAGDTAVECDRQALVFHSVTMSPSNAKGLAPMPAQRERVDRVARGPAQPRRCSVRQPYPLELQQPTSVVVGATPVGSLVPLVSGVRHGLSAAPPSGNAHSVPAQLLPRPLPGHGGSVLTVAAASTGVVARSSGFPRQPVEVTVSGPAGPVPIDFCMRSPSSQVMQTPSLQREAQSVSGVSYEYNYPMQPMCGPPRPPV